MSTLEDLDAILADLQPPSSKPAGGSVTTKVTSTVTATPPRPSISTPSHSTTPISSANAAKIAELEDMLADLGPSKPASGGNNNNNSSYSSSSNSSTNTYTAPSPRGNTTNTTSTSSSFSGGSSNTASSPRAPNGASTRTRTASISVSQPAPLRTQTSDLVICGKCAQEITGTYISALDKSWHPEHFTCGSCHKSLKGNFFETDKGILCDECASDQIKCSECRQPITGTHLIYSDGRPVHTHCVPQTKCSRCSNPLSLGDAHVEAMDKFWHPECFACTRCMTSLGSTFVQFEENPYCQSCIHILSKERSIVFKN